jgi:hypothetical protein
MNDGFLGLSISTFLVGGHRVGYDVGSDEKSDGWGDAWGGTSACCAGGICCVIVDLFSNQRPNRGVPALSITATPRNAKYSLVSQVPKDERMSVITVIDYSILKQCVARECIACPSHACAVVLRADTGAVEVSNHHCTCPCPSS